MAVCDLCQGDGFIALGAGAQECPMCLGTGETGEEEPEGPPGDEE